jgi:MFS-type transporter involved in bile tolerance (Atg22 family)
MNKKTKIAHWCFIVSMISWVLTMAITPVGGWAESNPFREYYMNTFCITGALTFITLIVWYKIENKINNLKNKY